MALTFFIKTPDEKMKRRERKKQERFRSSCKLVAIAVVVVLAVAAVASVAAFFGMRTRTNTVKSYSEEIDKTKNFYRCLDDEMETKNGFCYKSEIESRHGCLQFYEKNKPMTFHKALRFCTTVSEDDNRKGWLAETEDLQMNDDVSNSPRINQSIWVRNDWNVHHQPHFWLGGRTADIETNDFYKFRNNHNCNKYFISEKDLKDTKNSALPFFPGSKKRRHNFIWN